MKDKSKEIGKCNTVICSCTHLNIQEKVMFDYGLHKCLLCIYYGQIDEIYNKCTHLFNFIILLTDHKEYLNRLLNEAASIPIDKSDELHLPPYYNEETFKR